MKEIEILNYDPNLIEASPYQVREHFDEAALAELVASIREHGIIQPLTARESPHDPARLELVAGERRLRAARLGELKTVPVIVHTLTNRQAQEIVLIENLQREDLTVSEEARGYRKALDLRDEAGNPVYTQSSLAAKIGKPLTHVTDRLKLLQCPDFLIQAVEARTVALSTAMLVGRIPDLQERQKAAKRVLHPTIQEVPLNYEQTREMIREEFMVSLQKPGFDIAAADLLPEVVEAGQRVMGGSCLDCPYCANQAGEEARPRNSEGGTFVPGTHLLCTLPRCYHKKQDAAWKIVRRSAEEQGCRVIEGDAAAKLFSRYGGQVVHDAPYVELDAKPGWDDLGRESVDNKKSWRSLLKKAEIEVVVARHPQTGRRVELVDRKQAAVIAKAKLKSTDPKLVLENLEQAEAERKEQRKAELRQQKLERIILHESVSDLQAVIERKGLGVDELGYVFEVALGNSGADGMKFFKDWLELKLPKGTASSGRDYEQSILDLVRTRATTSQSWLSYIVVAQLARALNWSGCSDEDLQELMQRLGLKPEEIKRRAEAILNVTTGGKKAAAAEAVAPDEDEVKSGEVEDGAVEVEDPTKASEEIQAEKIAQGHWSYADCLGTAPKKDAPERKDFDRRRLRLVRLVKKQAA